MFRKFFAKLTRFGGEMPKQEPAEEKFRRTQDEESKLAEERRQANLRRMAEQGKKSEPPKDDVTEDLNRFNNEGNRN